MVRGHQVGTKAPGASPNPNTAYLGCQNPGPPNTNGSQFFIVDGTRGQTLAPNYTLFGKVTSGMSVVDKINADGNATASANGVPPAVLHRIVSVIVVES